MDCPPSTDEVRVVLVVLVLASHRATGPRPGWSGGSASQPKQPVAGAVWSPQVRDGGPPAGITTLDWTSSPLKPARWVSGLEVPRQDLLAGTAEWVCVDRRRRRAGAGHESPRRIVLRDVRRVQRGPAGLPDRGRPPALRCAAPAESRIVERGALIQSALSRGVPAILVHCRDRDGGVNGSTPGVRMALGCPGAVAGGGDDQDGVAGVAPGP
jgi:hypothetical protein